MGCTYALKLSSIISSHTLKLRDGKRETGAAGLVCDGKNVDGYLGLSDLCTEDPHMENRRDKRLGYSKETCHGQVEMNKCTGPQHNELHGTAKVYAW